MMVCICGHPEVDHVLGGRCRVPECPCDRFQPVPQVHQRWRRQVMPPQAAALVHVGEATGPVQIGRDDAVETI